jgi:gluconokinase
VKRRGIGISCVSFSAAMHSLLALDGDGEPITPSLTYADARAIRQAVRVRREHDGLSIHRRTGTPIHPMSPLTKLLWFREADPQTFERAVRWVSVKEYVLLKLCGEAVVDHSIASATGLLNLKSLEWDQGALELLGLDPERLSRPVPATHVLEGLGGTYAEEMGLDPQTPFVVGANDGVLANVGVGATGPGTVACSIGTSGAVRSVVREPLVDEAGRLFCYALVEGMWVVGGAINSGGLALSWLRENVLDLEDAPYEVMDDLAGSVPAGSDGLIFLPYLAGERAPQWDAGARAVLFGLGLRHGRGHLVRAVMEGVAYQMRAVARVLEEVTGRPEEVRATGGFSGSDVWRQVLADVLGHEVLYPDSPDGSCFGAALLGMMAMGGIEDLAEGRALVDVEHRHEPDAEAAGRHDELSGVFGRLYERLEPEFRAMERLRL